jgi:hypothetical protein
MLEEPGIRLFSGIPRGGQAGGGNEKLPDQQIEMNRERKTLTTNSTNRTNEKQ